MELIALSGQLSVVVALLTMNISVKPDCWDEDCNGRGACRDQGSPFDGVFACKCDSAEYLGASCEIQKSAGEDTVTKETTGAIFSLVVLVLVVIAVTARFKYNQYGGFAPNISPCWPTFSVL